VSIKERAFTIGNIVVVNGYRANQAALKQRFAEGGYKQQETAHFLLCTRAEAPAIILIHWFAPDEIDADLGNYFMQELKPLGILTSVQDFGELFGGVVFSLNPYNVQHALRLYATNTLQRYRNLLDATQTLPMANSTIHSFGQVYRHVCQLDMGESFLDAGCSFGFLPLLLAERFPKLSHIVGVDILEDPFPIVRDIAEELQMKNVQFVQADLMADDFASIGTFDTVTALHILEHFDEIEMYRVLTHLLQATAKQLVLAVPYEPGEPEHAYGHRQLFTATKFKAVGNWCLEWLGKTSRMTYEDCAGGLIIIERNVA
jgi:SAM-dependent methyltransferase